MSSAGIVGYFFGILILISLVACQEQAVFLPAIPAESPSLSPTLPPSSAATNSATEAKTEQTNSQSMVEEKAKANADVTYVIARLDGENSWTFAVSVLHPDSGWEDYADGWDVVLPDGTAVKPNPADHFTRLLLHPHENEQPFTRSQSGILIPPSVEKVIVRAHDIVDGYGGAEIVVDLTAVSGPGFEIQR